MSPRRSPCPRRCQWLCLAALTTQSGCTLQVQTIDGGYNSGRAYYFRAQTEEQRDAWVDALRAAVHRARLSKAAQDAGACRWGRRPAATPACACRCYWSAVCPFLVSPLSSPSPFPLPRNDANARRFSQMRVRDAYNSDAVQVA
jgi:hypothetical protein